MEGGWGAALIFGEGRRTLINCSVFRILCTYGRTLSLMILMSKVNLSQVHSVGGLGAFEMNGWRNLAALLAVKKVNLRLFSGYSLSFVVFLRVVRFIHGVGCFSFSTIFIFCFFLFLVVSWVGFVRAHTHAFLFVFAFSTD